MTQRDRRKESGRRFHRTDGTEDDASQLGFLSSRSEEPASSLEHPTVETLRFPSEQCSR